MKDKVFEIPDYEGACIYAILNCEELKAYIGKTTNAKRRAMEHSGTIRKKCTSPNKRFDFLILQKVDDETPTWLLNTLEKMYMLVIDFEGWELYNKEPRGHIGSYASMCVDIAQAIVYENNTKQRFNEAFKQKYGFDSWHLKVMKPETRVRATNEEQIA